jgi:ATP-dependent helicase HrpB
MAERLPVEAALPEVSRSLASGRSVVLQAPPGAGKTTAIPPALLDAPWLGDRLIVMLEPRRVAARAAAHRMAALRGEAVGESIGYRMRADSRVGPRTRLEVVTEGVLTRRLQRDPTLDDVGLIIFDEFHERSLVADLGLALALHSRSLVRDDLRLMVMSATLDTEAVARLLTDADVLRADGRAYAVETVYLPPRDPRHVEAAVAAAIRESLRQDEGEVLAFLPGTGEIRRVQEMLGDPGSNVDVLPLHGSVSAGEQDAAVAPPRAGRRRVVLATSIAETSLTIPGVRVVIDAGLARRPRFSARTGMTRLETVRVSRATADQRRGRAGRTAPGVCYRLWNEHESLVPAPLPEIVEADLAGLSLDLAVAGIRDPAELRWIDAPSAAGFGVAVELLRELGLVDRDGRPTPAGAQAAALPLHPRLARMVVSATNHDDRRTAADLAVLLSERDVVTGDGRERDPDLRLRLELIERFRRDHTVAPPSGVTVNRGVLSRIAHESSRVARLVGEASRRKGEQLGAGALAALAYPDRVGAARAATRGRFVLRAGIEVQLEPSSDVAGAEFVVVPELDGNKPLSRGYLAIPLDRTELLQLFSEQIEIVRSVEWNATSESVVSRERTMLGAIVLADRDLPSDPADTGRALLQVAIGRGLLDDDDVRQLVARVALARAVRGPAWPEWALDALRDTADDWLLPFALGVKRLADAQKIDVVGALLARLDARQRRELESLAPTYLALPTGTRARIDYSDPAAPSVSARIQELFGLAETPSVAGGARPLTIHLLSPANRPVQVTRDLAGFWKNSYFDVRKDLRGRYPKHPWPDDPLAATPTRRAKPR